MLLTKKISLCCIFLLFFSIEGSTQDIDLHHHYSKGLLSLRWFVEDPSEWAKLVKSGFEVQLTNINNKSIETHKLSSDRIYSKVNSDEIYTYLSMVLDEDQATVKNLRLGFPEGEIYEHNLNDVRQDIVDYLLHFDYQLVMDAGFGIQLELDSLSEYKITVSKQSETDTQEFILLTEWVFNPMNIDEPEIPEIKGQFSNKRVNLRWNTRNLNGKYYGYRLYESREGLPYELVDSLIINPQDTSSSVALHDSYFEHILEENKTLYSFKIHGVDYLGFESKKYAEVKGEGSKGLGISPVINRAQLLNSNEVKLVWELHEDFKDEVAEWKLYISEKWEGPYKLDTANIESFYREFTRPLPFEDNYWRVVGVDHNGIEHSSFPTLVTHLDTIPPATPTNLKAKIDTNGVVDLSWDQNYEKDFYGYKLFFGFDTTKEMTLANFKAFPESNFMDTVGLKSANRDLYYKVTAVDDRNNRSPFSKIVKLLKPDILAPASPNFYNYKSRPAGAFLAWHPSASGDVIQQQLFRRDIDNETEWSLINEWELPNIDSTFIDEDLVPTNTYAYFVMAKDSAGNYSSPSRPAVVKTLPKHDLDITLWTVSKLENTEVSISHEFDDTEIHSIHLFKKQQDKVPYEVAILDTDQRTFEDDAIKRNVTYSYFIKVIYNDGYETPYSEPKSIIYE